VPYSLCAAAGCVRARVCNGSVAPLSCSARCLSLAAARCAAGSCCAPEMPAPTRSLLDVSDRIPFRAVRCASNKVSVWPRAPVWTRAATRAREEFASVSLGRPCSRSSATDSRPRASGRMALPQRLCVSHLTSSGPGRRSGETLKRKLGRHTASRRFLGMPSGFSRSSSRPSPRVSGLTMASQGTGSNSAGAARGQKRVSSECSRARLVRLLSRAAADVLCCWSGQAWR
jgi:hypothetical protein